MNPQCALGVHQWSKCRCTLCGKTRHDFFKGNPCLCSRCLKSFHQLKGCECTRCNYTEHEWQGEQCSKCGKSLAAKHKEILTNAEMNEPSKAMRVARDILKTSSVDIAGIAYWDSLAAAAGKLLDTVAGTLTGVLLGGSLGGMIGFGLGSGERRAIGIIAVSDTKLWILPYGETLSDRPSASLLDTVHSGKGTRHAALDALEADVLVQ